MKKNYSLLIAVGALAAFLVSPLLAGRNGIGPMVIPVYGTETGETLINGGTPVFDGAGNMIGLDKVEIELDMTLNIPRLGIWGWEIVEYGAIDIRFGDGDPYILLMSSTGGLRIGDEVVLESMGTAFHRKTSATMSEKYITVTGIFTSGPLEGVILSWVTYTPEPLEDPPPFFGKVTGVLYVPEHVDLKDLKRSAKMSMK